MRAQLFPQEKLHITILRKYTVTVKTVYDGEVDTQ